MYFPFFVQYTRKKLISMNSTATVTAGLTFAAATILASPTTVASQVNRVLNTMLYENKPVYIGVSVAVAGQMMPATSVSQGPGSSAAGTAGSAAPGTQDNAANAGEHIFFVVY